MAGRAFAQAACAGKIQKLVGRLPALQPNFDWMTKLRAAEVGNPYLISQQFGNRVVLSWAKAAFEL